MSKKGFICFSKVGFAFQLIPAEKIIGKQVGIIRKEFAPDFDLLGIRYGTFQEPLDDADVLSQKYPLIISKEEPNKFLQPEFTLFPLSTIDKFSKWIIFMVRTEQENIEIPKFIVKIPEGSNLKAENLLKIAGDTLGLENNPIALEAENIEIDEETSLENIFKMGKQYHIYFHCELLENGLKTYKKRVNIIKEIEMSEQSYVQRLKTLIDFWIPQIKKRRIFTDQEFNLITDQIPLIYKCHKEFLDDLSELCKSPYSAQISQLFINKAKDFEIAVKFISNYTQISSIVEEKLKIPSIKKEFAALANQQNQQDFQSFLIVPIQRIPRYQLFLRDLIKCTPQSHPDSVLLKEAGNAIEKLLRNIDTKSKAVAQMWRLTQIEKNLLNSFKITKKGRKLILESIIRVKGHSDNAGSLYLFNDIVICTKEQQKGVTVLFDFPSEAFHYFYSDTNPNSIIVSAVCKVYNQSIIKSRKDYVVQFQSKEKMNEFLEKLKENQDQIAAKSELTLEWSLMKLKQNLPMVSGNAACANGASYFFFGGKKTIQKIPSSELTAVGQFGTDSQLESQNLTAFTTGRYGHTMSLVADRIFIIGGKNKQKFFKKILIYDIQTNRWYQMLPNSEVQFDPRVHHTSVIYQTAESRKLIIFGGKSAAGNILNTLTVYDLIDNVFENIPLVGANGTHASAVPSPRYHHSATIVKDRMIIHGGKSSKGKFLSDTWELDLETMTWMEKTPSGYKFSPRAFHTMFTINMTVLILGGMDQNGDSSPTLQLDTTNYKMTLVKDVGNVPNAIAKFASFVDRSQQLYIYGGVEKKMNIPSSAFYKLVPCEHWIDLMLNQKPIEMGHINPRKGFGTQKSMGKTQPFRPSQRLFQEGDEDFTSILKNFRGSMRNPGDQTDAGGFLREMRTLQARDNPRSIPPRDRRILAQSIKIDNDQEERKMSVPKISPARSSSPPALKLKDKPKNPFKLQNIPDIDDNEEDQLEKEQQLEEKMKLKRIQEQLRKQKEEQEQKEEEIKQERIEEEKKRAEEEQRRKQQEEEAQKAKEAEEKQRKIDEERMMREQEALIKRIQELERMNREKDEELKRKYEEDRQRQIEEEKRRKLEDEQNLEREKRAKEEQMKLEEEKRKMEEEKRIMKEKEEEQKRLEEERRKKEEEAEKERIRIQQEIEEQERIEREKREEEERKRRLYEEEEEEDKQLAAILDEPLTKQEEQEIIIQQTLQEEIPIFQEASMATPPAVIVESPKVTQTKKEVSVQKPIAEVLKEMSKPKVEPPPPHILALVKKQKELKKMAQTTKKPTKRPPPPPIGKVTLKPK